MNPTIHSSDPTTRTSIHSSNDWDFMNRETASVVSRRVGWIQKDLLPQFYGGFCGTEFDTREEVFSCSRNPRLGDDATCFECGWIIIQMVDDEIEYLWGASHRSGQCMLDAGFPRPAQVALSLSGPSPTYLHWCSPPGSTVRERSEGQKRGLK